MSNNIIDSDQAAMQIIGESNSIWTLEEFVTVSSPTYGFLESKLYENNVINIDGFLHAKASGIQAGGLNTLINVGEFGTISGYNGIKFDGAHQSVINNGVIYAKNLAVYGYGDMTGSSVENNGTMMASSVIFLHTGNCDVINSEFGLIKATKTAIRIDSLSGQESSIINDGAIRSRELAIETYGGDETIINGGRIRGDIWLGGGDDVFDTSRGSFLGQVWGGSGNDTYILGRSPVNIFEDTDEGVDTIMSSQTHRMANTSVENLILTGTSAISGTGNGLDNMLMGNKASNRISGDYGNDTINGSLGNDILTGGRDFDTFIFEKYSGRDIITDFTRGVDHIHLRGFLDVTSFEDLSGKMSQFGSNLIISLGGSDRLLIQNISIANINADDFQF